MIHYLSLGRRMAALTILTLVSSCTKPEQPTPTYSEKQRTLILEFVERGSNLQALTQQGVDVGRFNEEVAAVSAKWDVLVNTAWPDEFGKEREAVELALKGWRLAGAAWIGVIKSEPVIGIDEDRVRMQMSIYLTGIKKDTDDLDHWTRYVGSSKIAAVYFSAAGDIFQDAKNRIYARLR